MLKIIGMLALLSTSANAQVMWTTCENLTTYIKVNPQAKQSLSNKETMLDMLAKYQGTGLREFMIQKCTGTKMADGRTLNPAASTIKVLMGPQSPETWVTAVWDPRSNQWVVDNRRAVALWEQEQGGQSAMSQLGTMAGNAIRQAEQENAARLAAQQAEQKKLEDKRAVALKACGSAPSISGGPWFSSTYKIGATDAAQQALDQCQNFYCPVNTYLCVKNVEYLGPAVNPMGGNAARARFYGYNQQGEPQDSVRDFPY